MKKTLLALCAGVMMFGASAETYEKGEAFCYAINPQFSWFEGDEDYYAGNENWPALTLKGGANLEAGLGLGMVWFAQYNAGTPGPVAGTNTLEEAMAICPVVGDPWNANDYAIKMQADKWWAFGNFNFAMPQMNELSRIRVIYRVDVEGFEDYGNANPIYVRLNNTGNQDDCFVTAGDPVTAHYTNPGYRVVDLYHQLDADNNYLAITFMPGGLSCGGGKPAFYLEEVSVVPVSKLAGDTHVSGDTNLDVTATRPELVRVKGINDEASISEIAVSEKAAQGIYDLQGRKVAKATRGLYIIDGVKTFVK